MDMVGISSFGHNCITRIVYLSLGKPPVHAVPQSENPQDGKIIVRDRVNSCPDGKDFCDPERVSPLNHSRAENSSKKLKNSASTTYTMTHRQIDITFPVLETTSLFFTLLFWMKSPVVVLLVFFVAVVASKTRLIRLSMAHWFGVERNSGRGAMTTLS